MLPINPAAIFGEAYELPSCRCNEIYLSLTTRIQEIAQSIFDFIQETYVQIQTYFYGNQNLAETHDIIPIQAFEKNSEEANAISTLISMRAKAWVPTCLSLNSDYRKAKEIVFGSDHPLDPLNILAHIKSSPSLLRKIRDPNVDWTPFTDRLSDQLRAQEDLLSRAEILTKIFKPQPKLKDFYLNEIKNCLKGCDGEGLLSLLSSS